MKIEIRKLIHSSLATSIVCIPLDFGVCRKKNDAFFSKIFAVNIPGVSEIRLQDDDFITAMKCREV